MTDVEDLLAQMTLEEKLAQLGCVWSTQLVDGPEFSLTAAARLMPHGTGQVTRIAASTGLRPQGLAVFHNEIQRWLLEETRLGIPAIIHEEAVAGFCARDAVQFPQAIGLGATWDRDLVEEVADHIRTEMLAVGARQSLSPVLDIGRDPRWGRVEETYGEDPVLAGELGVAYVRGLQGTGPVRPDGSAAPGLAHGVVATGKHFLGYGLPDGGLNHGPVQLGSRELREVFAEPFAAAIRDAGMASVMNSYSSVDGLPCAGAPLILTELLRDELGFTGTVVADYFAVDLLRTHHRVAPTKAVAAAKALMAGMDVELPALDCFAQLAPLVEAGVVPVEVVDAAVRRVLLQKVDLGLFEHPYVDDGAAPAAFGTPAGRDLARRAAVESLVLLDNDGTVPLARRAPGPDRRHRTGGRRPPPARGRLPLPRPPRDHLRHRRAGSGGGAPAAGRRGVRPRARSCRTSSPPSAGCGPRCWVPTWSWCTNGAATSPGRTVPASPPRSQAASGADVVVLCVGGRSGLTLDATVGEARDAVDLDLTGVQLELLDRVAATGTPVVTVVVSGRVHTLDVVEERSAATLLAWLPGIEGGTALADVLLGAVAPSGRLPVSLPRSVGQVPVHYNHRAGGGRSQFWGDYTDSPSGPLHPFGFGLSTTTFTYSPVLVEEGSTTEPTRVTVTVTNSGGRSGAEVVQCYVHDETASVARPERQLVGFTRIDLDPGEARRVTFVIHPSRLAFFDENFHFVCEPGAFRVEVGGCAGGARGHHHVRPGRRGGGVPPAPDRGHDRPPGVAPPARSPVSRAGAPGGRCHAGTWARPRP